MAAVRRQRRGPPWPGPPWTHWPATGTTGCGRLVDNLCVSSPVVLLYTVIRRVLVRRKHRLSPVCHTATCRSPRVRPAHVPCQVGSFAMGGGPGGAPPGKAPGPPAPVKKLLSMFGSGREEDKMVGGGTRTTRGDRVRRQGSMVTRVPARKERVGGGPTGRRTQGSRKAGWGSGHGERQGGHDGGWRAMFGMGYVGHEIR